MPVDVLEHLPVGFGAHHWVGRRGGIPLLFVTYDRLEPKRTLAELEAAYAGAARLAAEGLDFVLAGRPSPDGRYAVPFAGGAVSVTPWHEGTSGNGTFRDAAEAGACADMLTRLHTRIAPPGIPPWRPLVGADLAMSLTTLAADPWTAGPYGERARAALRDRLGAVARWTDRYLALAEHARKQRARWVATHGEPDTGNQLITGDHRFLVDWESLRLAPRERDLRALVEAGFGDPVPGSPDPLMLEMFDLEWRLDEISQ
jgi:spectinomycin phosphotransferase